ncbi:MAG: nickel-dependent lactate racemase, partial [Desulfuromonadales bacterium]|nr:nickel-dependent lactate racemase [Desulfuromonadales bacterium]
MNIVDLKYGNRKFSGKIPAARILQPQLLPSSIAPDALISSALAQPIGTAPLAEIVKPGETVAIVTSDITRYSGSELYLPLLVAELNRCGIADGDIEIIIALGIHRYQTEVEQHKIVGSLYGRIAVYDHECDDPDELVDLGITDSGIPVEINRRVVAADRVIVTGTIGFHYFAGFGGGRKGLVPGVASRKTCMASHFAIFNPPELGGRNAKACTANLEGNPVHHAILEAAHMIKPDFLLNTVLTTDKQIAKVFCGNLEQAHLAGCELAQTL